MSQAHCPVYIRDWHFAAAFCWCQTYRSSSNITLHCTQQPGSATCLSLCPYNLSEPHIANQTEIWGVYPEYMHSNLDERKTGIIANILSKYQFQILLTLYLLPLFSFNPLFAFNPLFLTVPPPPSSIPFSTPFSIIPPRFSHTLIFLSLAFFLYRYITRDPYIVLPGYLL